MKLVAIEKKTSTEKVIVNTEQICSIFQQGDVVIISTGDDRLLETKFTDIHHAVDFIARSVFVPEPK